MFLDTVDKTIEVVLDAATSIQCDVVGSYADITENTFKPGSTDMTTSDTTRVTVIPAPLAGVQRQVKEVIICNPDDIDHTVLLYLVNGASSRLIMERTLTPGATLAYRPDALSGPAGVDGATGAPAGASGTPADFGVCFLGKPDDSQEIFMLGLTRSIELPALLTGSVFVCRIAPTSDYVITLLQNTASIGSITFAAGLTAGVATFTDNVVLNANDLFEITGQAIHDATIEDISLAFSSTFF